MKISGTIRFLDEILFDCFSCRPLLLCQVASPTQPLIIIEKNKEKEQFINLRIPTFPLIFKKFNFTYCSVINNILVIKYVFKNLKMANITLETKTE